MSPDGSPALINIFPEISGMEYLYDIQKKVYGKKQGHQEPDKDYGERRVYTEQPVAYIKGKEDKAEQGKKNEKDDYQVKKEDMMVVYQEEGENRITGVKEEERKRECLYSGKKIGDSGRCEGCKCYE